MNMPRILGAQRQLHQKCVQHVIGHVSTHLSEHLKLHELAEIAGFSPYHFHRMFRRVTGEAVTECIRRLRLERAATLLTIDPDANVLDIAMQAGFNSQHVFARAFHARFGMSASQWRDGDFWWYNGRHWDWRHAAERRRLQAAGQGRTAGVARMYYVDHAMADAAEGKRPACITRLEVKELPALRVAHLHMIGAITEARWRPAWQRLEKLAAEYDMKPLKEYGTVCHHGSPTVTAPEHMRYELGLVVRPDAIAPPEMDLRRIAGGKYVVFDYDGPVTDDNIAWEYISQYWLPLKRLQFDAERIIYTRVPLPQHTLPWVPSDQNVVSWRPDITARYQNCIPVNFTRYSAVRSTSEAS
jgi:AraC family transcriptional regulator